MSGTCESNPSYQRMRSRYPLPYSYNRDEEGGVYIMDENEIKLFTSTKRRQRR